MCPGYLLDYTWCTYAEDVRLHPKVIIESQGYRGTVPEGAGIQDGLQALPEW